jgi:hypothetical protein
MLIVGTIGHRFTTGCWCRWTWHHCGCLCFCH